MGGLCGWGRTNLQCVVLAESLRLGARARRQRGESFVAVVHTGKKLVEQCEQSLKRDVCVYVSVCLSVCVCECVCVHHMERSKVH
jgi:hypothetical protein